MCGRELIQGKSIDNHHMIPKAKKGTGTETIHRVCHQKIHSVFTEKELANWYYTWDRINDHDEIKKFIKWVARKDPEFYGANRDTAVRKSRRRR